MEGDRRPRPAPGQAQRGGRTVLGALWHLLSQHLTLLCCRPVLALCRALSAAMAGHGQRGQRGQRGGRPERPGAAWGAADPSDCAICLRPCEPRRPLKLLSCSHVYHGSCIDRWHRAQPGTKSCPLCRREVTAVLLGQPGTHSPRD